MRSQGQQPDRPHDLTPERQFERFRRSGDATALAAVFDALAPELLLAALHLAPVSTDAEDLVQGTFLDAIEKAQRWDAMRPLRPWLVGILANRARELRRQHARAIDPARLPQQQPPSPLDAAATAEVQAQIAEAVQSLPRQYRQVLTLRLAHGLSPAAIAHALGCPVATAKTRLQRGMEWLRRLLPAGVAASAVLVLTAGRGLAAVREAVLQRAPDLLPAAPLAVTATLCGLAMKKILVAATAAVLALVAWQALGAPAGPGEPLVDDAGAAQVASAVAADSATSAAVPAADAAARTQVATDASATTGALQLEFVWRELGTAAAHLHVSARDGADHEFTWTADGLGRVEAAGMPASDYFLFGSKLWHRISVRPGEVTAERIEVEPGLRIDGVVVDEFAEPVAGATIAVQDFARPDDLEPRAIARSRADGTFTAAVDFGGSVWAHDPGHAPSACELLHDGTATLRLQLGASAATVIGTVRSDDGVPIAGASVIIARTSVRDLLAAPLLLRTDDAGGFRTDEVTAGAHLLAGQAPGFAAVPVRFAVESGQVQVLDVRLSRGARLHGRVHRPDGAPLRARLELRPMWAGGAVEFLRSLHPLYQRCMQRVATDAQGNWALDHVPTGTVAIEVDVQPGTEHDRRELELADGEQRQCDFELAIAPELRGRAVDVRDAPLAGWRVEAIPLGGGHVRDSDTAADGGFVLSGLDRPEYTLGLRPGDSPVPVPWLRLDRVRPQQGELLLRLPCGGGDGGWFVGVARGANDRPVAAALASVAAVGVVQGHFVRLDLDDQGAFRLGPLPPGDYRLELRVDGQGSMALGVHTLPAAGEVDLGTARLPAAGTLELRFRRADGRVAVPDDVTVRDRVGNAGKAMLAADGVFRTGPLPAGTYRVRAWGDDIALLDGEATVIAERASATELTVVDAPSVRFEMRIEGDAAPPPTAPRPGVHLVLRGRDGKVLAWTSQPCGADGRLSWTRGLLPGSYSYEAHLQPDGAATAGAFAVAAGSGEPQRVEVVLPRR